MITGATIHNSVEPHGKVLATGHVQFSVHAREVLLHRADGDAQPPV
jgi:hypothetical protein